MKPNFPMKNWAVKGLIGFRKADTIYKCSKALSDNHGFERQIMASELEVLELQFDRMEEEINQVVYTSNDATKIALFEELKKNISDFDLFTVDRQNIKDLADSWNDEKNAEFKKIVEKKTEEYLSQPEVKKYAHREVYTVKRQIPYFLRIGGSASQDSVYTNYKFYQVTERPELIDYACLDTYIEVLQTVTNKFIAIVEPLITRYDEGKIVLNKQIEEPLSDKWLRKIKNSPVGAVIIILAIVATGAFALINGWLSTSEGIGKSFGKTHPSDSIQSSVQKENDSQPTDDLAPQNKNGISLDTVSRDTTGR